MSNKALTDSEAAAESRRVDRDGERAGEGPEADRDDEDQGPHQVRHGSEDCHDPPRDPIDPVGRQQRLGSEDRERIDSCVQDVAGIRAIENEIYVRDDAEAESQPARSGSRHAQR